MRAYVHPPPSAVASKPVAVAVTEPTPQPPARARRSRRVDAALDVDVPENRAGVDDVNRILGKNLSYRPGTLGLFDRLRKVGYKQADWIRVLEAVRDGSTQSAAWAKQAPAPLEWILRPGADKAAGFDRIMTQLETGQKAQPPAPQPGVIHALPETVDQIRARKRREAEARDQARAKPILASEDDEPDYHEPPNDWMVN